MKMNLGLPAILAAAFFLMILFRGCSAQSAQMSESPAGTHTLIVEYDWMSRPTIYEKAWYGKKKIWQYGGNGFMESVSFEIRWISEDKIFVFYDDAEDRYDEAFWIDIP